MVDSHCFTLIKNRPGSPCVFRMYHFMYCLLLYSVTAMTHEHSEQKKIFKEKVKLCNCWESFGAVFHDKIFSFSPTLTEIRDISMFTRQVVPLYDVLCFSIFLISSFSNFFEFCHFLQLHVILQFKITAICAFIHFLLHDFPSS